MPHMRPTDNIDDGFFLMGVFAIGGGITCLVLRLWLGAVLLLGMGLWQCGSLIKEYYFDE